MIPITPLALPTVFVTMNYSSVLNIMKEFKSHTYVCTLLILFDLILRLTI